MLEKLSITCESVMGRAAWVQLQAWWMPCAQMKVLETDHGLTFIAVINMHPWLRRRMLEKQDFDGILKEPA